MKSLQEGGRKELAALSNRVLRAFGMGRINQGSFLVLRDKIEELDTLLLAVEEDHPERREF